MKHISLPFGYLLLFSVVYSGCFFAQEQNDSLPYRRYYDHPVVYSDLGFNSAPVTIAHTYPNGLKRLRYKNNMSAVWGFGVAYKWFALRFGITVPGTLKSVGHFGKTRYYDLGVDFSVKRWFVDLDLHSYSGFAIKDAYRWNDTLSQLHPHDIRPDINATSISINGWYFHSGDFKMTAFRGKTGAYTRDIRTWYLKSTFNIHTISSDNQTPLIPLELQDSLITKTQSNAFGAVDLGVVPGYAYVKRWKSFQAGAMGGLGLVIQSKLYSSDGYIRGFLGLAPRYDFKFIAGYNLPRWFVMFVSDFDNKSVRFGKLSYRQTYYSVKLVAGYRFNKPKKTVKQERAILPKGLPEKFPAFQP